MGNLTVIITAKMATRCLTCEEQIEPGEQVRWAKGVGVWHLGCKEPRSLTMYRKEQAERKRLGLD